MALRKKAAPLEKSAQDLKTDFAKTLDDFLADNVVTYEGPNAYDLAVGIANQQQARWGRLLFFLQDVDISNGQAIRNHLNQLFQMLQPLATSANVRNLGEKSIVTSSLPVLRKDPDQKIIGTAKQFPIFAALILASKCQEALAQSNNPHAVTWLLAANSIDFLKLTELNAAGPDDYLSEYIDETTSKIDAAVQVIEKAWQSIDADSKAQLNELQRKQDYLETFLTQINDAEASRKTQWDSERKESIEALRSEVNEYIKIESSIDLWRTKARWHTAAYFILSIVFGGALVVVAVLFLGGFINGFLEEVKKIPADHQFVGVAVLAIPTLAIAWLLRFIARLTIQNFALAHDARQRHAQVLTYLRLLGDPKKPISENERILALAALFRPLPGQGPEDVNPPTIADILKESQQKMLRR